jgi:hypothetical protein
MSLLPPKEKLRFEAAKGIQYNGMELNGKGFAIRTECGCVVRTSG